MSDDAYGLRPLLFSIAYRMLGSVSEAEDAVQEAFLRYHRALADGTVVESPKAFLSAVTTRLCIDHLKSARARRETYVGEWLPEPLVTEDDPALQAERADSLSMAFLLLLERLSPAERAVFLLHDVFGYSYDEIAPIVGKSVDNCRQLASRARRHVDSGRPRFEESRQRRRELAERLVGAMLDADVEGVLALLSHDVVVVGDSGGGSPSWPRPITSRDRVARLLASMGAQAREAGVTLRLAEVNGQPGTLAYAPDGSLVSVWVYDVADGAVQTVRSIINPDKLDHLGPVTDVRDLIRELRNRPVPPGVSPA